MSQHVPIEQIRLPPEAPKTPPLITPAEIEIAQAHGITEPVMLRPGEQPGSYYLVGEGRGWWVAQQAMIPTVPAVIVDLSTEEVNDLNRTDSPLVQARAWQRIYEQERAIKQRGALTRTAARVGTTKPSLHRWLKLLNLEIDILTLIDQGKISPSVGGLLLNMKPEQRKHQAQRLIGKSYAQARKMLRQTASSGKYQQSSGQKELTDLFDENHADPEISHLEQELTDLVGLPSRIETNQGQGGVLAFRYHSLEELEGLMMRLGWMRESDF